MALHAQQTVSSVHPTQVVAATPLLASLQPETGDLASAAGVSYSSSAIAATDVASAEKLDLPGLAAGAFQPPPRRRYGRPRYSDRAHNADGSNKLAFEAGVGFEAPVSDTSTIYKPSYALQVGAGRNFNKNVAVMIQFDYDRLGVQDSVLRNQIAFYNALCPPASDGISCTTLSSLNGNAHVWSFSIDPTYTFYGREAIGAYVVGGVGFYHKVTNFTTPQTGVAYDPYYGYYNYTADQVIDHYTSNAPGFNGGVGFTYKFSRFANERFFAEARYVYIFNQARPGATYNSTTGVSPTNYAGNNLFPANSNRTSYIPIKFGIRF